MKTRSKMLYVAMVMVSLAVANSELALSPTQRPESTAAKQWPRTTGLPEQNLRGKMFTLSYDGGGISFFPPYFSPASSSSPYSTSYYTTTRPYPTTTYPHWTTPPVTRGVSVCVRFLTDYQRMNYPTIFTLSPSSTSSLKLGISFPGPFVLGLNRYSYYDLYIKPNIRFWSNIEPEIWTRVCLTVDSVKRVAQVFNGSNMSIRRRMPFQYVWSGDPVIEFSGFDGQVTDVQVWDYPLNYKEIFNYMTNGIYAPYRGSILTWSSISYSDGGNVLLEDVYEGRARQPISSRRRGRQPKGEKNTWEFADEGERERKEKKREQL
ncbi:uncharacterized protein [Pempheris klunzingeri]|uniref:uncharacterized protein n=1 Tax=Pempheris klunzingeri TaxID=3127111 RepID=UPI0039809D03